MAHAVADHLSLLFSSAVDLHVRPLLKNVQLPGVLNHSPYLKLQLFSYIPLSTVFFLVALLRGRLTINRVLGLYIFVFLAASASIGFNYLLSEYGIYDFDLVSSIYDLEGVTLEHFLQPLFHTLLVGVFFLATHRPGPVAPARFGVGSSVYARLWGAGLLLAEAGYLFLYLRHAQFTYLRYIAVLLFPVLALQYLSFAPYIIANSRSSFGTLLSALVPTVSSLLVYAAAHQLHYYRISSKSIIGLTFLGVPVEEIGLISLVSTCVVQALLIWDAIAEPAPRPPREQPRIGLVKMTPKKQATGTPVASPQKKQEEATKKDTPQKKTEEKEEKEKKEVQTPSKEIKSPTKTAAGKNAAPEAAAASDAAPPSPTPAKKSPAASPQTKKKAKAEQ